MKSKIINSSFNILLVSLLLLGCANQQPPAGGPVDATTPEIIWTYPENNARNFNEEGIRIKFDRYVDERTFQESVFISPYVGEMEFDWSGTEVKIIFSEELKHNTTYVINIGTDVKDRYRNQLSMTKAYTLAFSTGPDIDCGAVEGMVFPAKDGDPVTGIMIFAYKLDGLNSDTLNPAAADPDFITQTGRKGDFFLRHIPFGEYRIFAMKDEYRNLVYDIGVDEYGVQSARINITPADSIVKNVFMKLAKEDTTGPTLVKVSAPLKDHVIAEFSEAIDPLSVTSSSFSITDTLDGKRLGIAAIFPYPPSNCVFIASTEKQDSGRTYNFTARNITDSLGNRINIDANSFLFEGSAKADTLGPRLVSVSIKDSTQEVSLCPRIEFIFSDALIKTDSIDIGIYDDSKKQIAAKKEWVSQVLIAVTPEKDLKSRSWYTLSADLHRFHDWSGRNCRDSVRSWHFETLDAEDITSIEGSVTGIKKNDAGKIKVSANRVGEKDPMNYIVTADAAGKFIFPQVSGGKYMLQVFCDANGNGKYNPGLPFPFSYSEQLGRFSDTLRVRPRWPLDGIIIQME